MLTAGKKNQRAGYVKLSQQNSFDDEGYFDASDRANQSIQRPFTFRTFADPKQSYVNITTPIMESVQESENIYSISAPERSAIPHRTSIEEEDSATNTSTWSQLSKKFKLKGKNKRRKDRDIYLSVFKPYPGLQNPQLATAPLSPNHQPPLNKEQFDLIVESVKTAIASGMQPQRISQGSSGSYFCRNKEGKIVSVFKPKNEEPYGHLNPKWTKWIHRNLFPCFFGRSCLIPNLGYISEAAASLLDRRLSLNIVPFTDVIRLSSSSFHYDYFDRHAAKSKKNPKPLPEKIGSFQVFLDGFKDANVFLRDYPWPEYYNQNSDGQIIHEQTIERNHSRLNAFMCRGSETDDDGESYPLGKRFAWTQMLQDQFIEQFEKLVILDYLMRNTDRGLDNWMIKYCEQDDSISIAITPPKPMGLMMTNISVSSNSAAQSTNLKNQESRNIESTSVLTAQQQDDKIESNNNDPLSSSKSPSALARLFAEHESNTSINNADPDYPAIPYPHVHLAAIDNGLAFPFKHPDSWRSYPYAWLYLPQSLISRPFTEKTRNHFLSLLTSPQWWKETVEDLRRLFSMDTDFDEGMFEKQISVLKGQGWNIVETLSQFDQGPLDLVARQNVVVIDEETLIDEDAEDVGFSDAELHDLESHAGGISAFGEERGEPSNIEIGVPQKTRRSLSEDSASIQRPSAAASIAGKSSNTASTRGHKWAAKFKTRFNLDLVGRDRDALEGKTKRQVVIERLETVNGAVPLFTWC